MCGMSDRERSQVTIHLFVYSICQKTKKEKTVNLLANFKGSYFPTSRRWQRICDACLLIYCELVNGTFTVFKENIPEIGRKIKGKFEGRKLNIILLF